MIIIGKIIDFFLCLMLASLVTGGFAGRIAGAWVDVATVDTFAIIPLAFLLLTRGKAYAHSKILKWAENLLLNEQSSRWVKGLFTLTFGGLILGHIAKHWALHTHGYDVSYVHQALFNPFGPPFFPATISPSGTALGDHLLFSLVPLSLLTQFIRIDEFLFVIQGLAAAIPLYLLLTRGPLKNSPSRWLWAGFFLLSFRSLRSGISFDFREDVFAFAGLTLMIFSLIRNNVAGYLAALALALTSKENVFLYTTFFCVPIFFSSQIGFNKHKRILLSLVTVVVSLVYGIIGLKVLHPYFTGAAAESAHPIVSRLSFLGESPYEIFMTVLTDPSSWPAIFHHCFNSASINYLVRMLLPALPFIALKRWIGKTALINAWTWMVPALAAIGINVISGSSGQTSMNFHYDLVALPALFMAILTGMQSFLSTHQAPRPVLVMLLLFAFCFSDKWPGFHITHHWPTLDQVKARIALLKLDRDAAVIVNRRLSAQLNQHLDLRVQTIECNDGQPLVDDQTFQGYVVLNPGDPLQSNCQVDGSVIFENSEIRIHKL